MRDRIVRKYLETHLKCYRDVLMNLKFLTCNLFKFRNFSKYLNLPLILD